MFSTKEPILKVFDEIESGDHVARVLFYEQNTRFIFALDELKQHYFTFHYIQSLFELGKFDHVLAEIDPLIEFVFLNEVFFLPAGTFEKLLYKKTVAYYKLVKYDEAILLGEQLIGMKPENWDYRQLMQRIYRAKLNFTSTNIRLTALILIFFSAIISATLWLITMSHQEATLIQSFFIIISPCLVALGLLGGAHIYNYLKAIKLTNLLVGQKMKKHNNA